MFFNFDFITLISKCFKRSFEASFYNFQTKELKYKKLSWIIKKSLKRIKMVQKNFFKSIKAFYISLYNFNF